MNKFLSKLQLTYIDDDMWEVASPLMFESDRLNKTVIVPVGFKTDLASVPPLPIMHTLFADVGKPAAVVHDFLLVEGKMHRTTIDDVYYDALKVCGAGWKAKPMKWGTHFYTWLKGVFT